VQLFRVSGPPIAVILQNIRTTWDACFITWNKAYCLFPVSSFITHEPFLLAPLKEVTTPDEEGKVQLPASISHGHTNGDEGSRQASGSSTQETSWCLSRS
jgi:hypothetical protein